MSTITLRQLEILTQVVEHGSFRRCAESIGITPVSISEHIHELESRLGCTLFIRKPGHPAALTAKGQTAYERANEILKGVNDLVWSLNENTTSVNRFHVTFPPYIARSLLDSITEFETKHPNIKIETDLNTGSPEALITLVQQRKTDLAYILTFNDNIPDTELITEEPMAIFVAKNHPLTQLDSVNIEDFSHVPAIQLTAKNPLRILVDQVLRTAGFTNFDVALTTDEYGLVLSSVAQGKGYVCMFESNEQESTNLENLTRLKLNFSLPKIQVRCIARRASHHHLLLQELQNTLTQSYKKNQKK